MKRPKETTYTSIVYDYLCGADDFRKAAHVVEATKLTSGHVSTSLHALKAYRAVDCIEQDHSLWWFATPETDTRLRVVLERTPETKKRRLRKKPAGPVTLPLSGS